MRASAAEIRQMWRFVARGALATDRDERRWLAGFYANARSCRFQRWAKRMGKAALRMRRQRSV